eukprot:scaffold2107_cov222-Pinguiococcus_pyrenoidosus.AAC.9
MPLACAQEVAQEWAVAPKAAAKQPRGRQLENSTETVVALNTSALARQKAFLLEKMKKKSPTHTRYIAHERDARCSF